MIEIIAILVAAGDGEYLGAQDVGDAMSDEKWIARIGDQGCELRCDAERLFDGSKQHDPAIGGPPATIEGRFDFLHCTDESKNGKRVSSTMAGAAASDSGEVGFDTQISSSNQKLTLYSPANS